MLCKRKSIVSKSCPDCRGLIITFPPISFTIAFKLDYAVMQMRTTNRERGYITKSREKIQFVSIKDRQGGYQKG